MEEFLHEWWPAHLHAPPPTGAHAIALMRLVVQVQTPEAQAAVYRAWQILPPADAQVSASDCLSDCCGDCFRWLPMASASRRRAHDCP